METRQPGTIAAYYDSFDKWLSADVYPAPNGISVYYKDVTQGKTAERSRAQLRAAE